MSEYLSKKAVLEWLESEMSINKGHPDDIDIHWTLNRVSKKILSGAFDADDSKVHHLRAALEDIRYQVQQSDHPAGLGILATINQALSTTTEPTGAERVREIDEILALHSEKIAHHRQSGDIKSEYFYRGYNAALRMERNRYTSGINTPKGDGNA